MAYFDVVYFPYADSVTAYRWHRCINHNEFGVVYHLLPENSYYESHRYYSVVVEAENGLEATRKGLDIIEEVICNLCEVENTSKLREEE